MKKLVIWIALTEFADVAGAQAPGMKRVRQSSLAVILSGGVPFDIATTGRARETWRIAE